MSKLTVIFRICTSYEEVRRSFVKWNPPAECLSSEMQLEWWQQYYPRARGLLHRIRFKRIVLDEAHAIKNRTSQTFRAVKALDAEIRWAITGTPAHNAVEEFYPYFAFLQVPQSGRFDTFKKNFCDPESGFPNERLHSFLRQFMIRRTHKDSFLGAPLLKLPKNNQRTILIDLNSVERTLYEMVRKRYAKKITRYHLQGVAEKNKRNILTWLLRLRQMTSHCFLLQAEIQDLIEGEDMEALQRQMKACGQGTSQGEKMLAKMREALKQKRIEESQQPMEIDDIKEPDDGQPQATPPIVFEFRKILKELAKSSNWDAWHQRTLCNKCGEPCTDPWITDCMHIYCHECLNDLAMEAAADNEDHTACLECGHIYKKTTPCTGLRELNIEESPKPSDSGTPIRHSPRRRPKPGIEWMRLSGSILPSSKTCAMIAQMNEWIAQDPDAKILIFSQFEMM